MCTISVKNKGVDAGEDWLLPTMDKVTEVVNSPGARLERMVE
uniref:PLAT domain-containing protein n=1 Tax=Ascaris lumbricoides TaxID=6252 RepID=A0A0M3IDB9_ASCLU